MATPITSISPIPTSPTMSSASSFDMVSSRSRSSTTSDVYFDDSDDEIVWNVASDESLSSSSELSVESSTFPASDDDFVVLSRPRSPRVSITRLPPPPSEDLASGLASLSVNEVSSIIRRNKKAAAATVKLPGAGAASPKRTKGKPTTARPVSHSPSPSATPVSDRPSSVATLRKGSASPSGKANRRRRKNKSGSSSPVAGGFGARPIVDDISEHASERGDDEFAVQSVYDTAAFYINSFLADPTSVCRLTLLQSLIVELGLGSSSLPASLTAAKAMLRSHVFVNVGEYLDARQKGPAAVQGVMHKSKSSLIRDLRKRRNPVPLQWVKETGLQVLLVSCYH